MRPWLIVGSDARDAAVTDDTRGARSDSIMLLHKAPSGQASPDHPAQGHYVGSGYGEDKINAACSRGPG